MRGAWPTWRGSFPAVTIPDLGARANSSNSLIIIRGLNVNDPVDLVLSALGQRADRVYLRR